MAEKYFSLYAIKEDFDWLKSQGAEDITCREVIERLENGIIKESDVASVVRCKDCKYCDFDKEYGDRWCKRNWEVVLVKGNDFCSYGERKEPENEQSN